MFFVALVILCGSASAKEYWISFTGLPPISPYPTFAGGPKYLMKIDELGNVLIAPKKVVRNSMGFVGPKYGATTLNSDSRYVHMWMPSSENSYPEKVFHAVISKKSLQLVALRKTRAVTVNTEYLQVTHRKSNNFLATQESLKPPQQETQWYSGVPLTDRQSITGPQFMLYPTGVGCLTVAYSCSLGVSPDGKIFFFINGKINSSDVSGLGLVLQQLDPTGQPKARKVLIKGATGAADISNKMANNRRFAIYSSHHILYLQILTADSLEFVGERIQISARGGSGTQTVAIEPSGRFVIFVKRRNLFFQALDPLGHPSGSPKTVATDVFTGVDIARD
jgi:hypothetical protein